MVMAQTGGLSWSIHGAPKNHFCDTLDDVLDGFSWHVIWNMQDICDYLCSTTCNSTRRKANNHEDAFVANKDMELCVLMGMQHARSNMFFGQTPRGKG